MYVSFPTLARMESVDELGFVARGAEALLAAHRGEFVDRLDGELASDGGDALELVPTEAVDEIGPESGDGDVARARGPRERRARRAHLFLHPSDGG